MMKKLIAAGFLIILLLTIIGCGTDKITTNDLAAAPSQKTADKTVTAPVQSVAPQPDEQADSETPETVTAIKSETDNAITPDSKNTFALHLTRDFGGEVLDSRSVEIKSDYSLLEYMQEEWQVTTGFGGGFIKDINGLKSAANSGDRYDWFFYVNGEVSPVGAGQVKPDAGDVIYWDYHLWSSGSGPVEANKSFPPVE